MKKLIQKKDKKVLLESSSIYEMIERQNKETVKRNKTIIHYSDDEIEDEND